MSAVRKAATLISLLYMLAHNICYTHVCEYIENKKKGFLSASISYKQVCFVLDLVVLHLSKFDGNLKLMMLIYFRKLNNWHPQSRKKNYFFLFKLLQKI